MFVLAQTAKLEGDGIVHGRTGIYGMNFENMPELKTRYGYFVVLGVITVVCVALHIGFKCAIWLGAFEAG